MTALERLKMIQAEFKSRWVGINTDYTGRPGTSLMCNQDRNFPMTPQEKEEWLRSDRFMRVFNTLRNIENDHPLMLGVGSDRAAKSGTNFFNAKSNKIKEENSQLNASQYLYNAPENLTN